MTMDRAELIGLGAAIGGHALLLALLVFGLLGSEEKIEERQAIAVTLEGEGTPLPVTSQIGEAEPAPEAAVLEEAAAEVDEAAETADSKADEAQAAEADAKRAADTAKAADATAAQKRAAKAAAAKAQRKRKEAAAAEAKRKKAAQEAKRKRQKAARDKTARDKAAREKYDRDMKKALGGSNAPSATAKRKAKATIGGQIRIRGCPPGLEVEKIITRVSINLNKNGSISSLSRVTQSGKTSSNAPQMAPIKRCVLNSIRASAPFRGLKVEDYESWKSIRIAFKVS
ncbi:MAG: hypothetical protein V3V15_09305 [Sphingorhabdus sp.]